jgi:catechol 2,3-dioxygenase-like lactoylglutathione lyase family enzyme
MDGAPHDPVAVRSVIVILACDDVARSREFYVRAFGWKVGADFPVYVEMEAATGVRVGLYLREGFAKNTGEPPAPRPARGTTASEIYLYVDDVTAAFARLLAAGGRPLSRPAPRVWGDEAGYVADPDGNVVAVARPLAEPPNS